MMLMLSIHGTRKIVRRRSVLQSILFTRFCLMFLKINVAITCSFMGEICYLEKVKLSIYIRHRHLLHEKDKRQVVFIPDKELQSLFQDLRAQLINIVQKKETLILCSTCPHCHPDREVFTECQGCEYRARHPGFVDLAGHCPYFTSQVPHYYYSISFNFARRFEGRLKN